MTLNEQVKQLGLGRLVLFAVGIQLIASGVAHLAYWMLVGGSWEGPLSLRKPILFGFSAGTTVVSIAWVVGKMRSRKGDDWLFATFGVAMLLEVGLITLQQWRGVASHFNRDTPFDAAVSNWTEMLILVATIIIAEVTRRCFARLSTSSDMSLAIRSGMVLLLFSCLLGFVLVYHANQQLASGGQPGVYGAAGVMKFPHGVPMHAIQMLPIFVFALGWLGVREHVRYRSLAFLLAAQLGYTVYSLVQTFSGRGRFEMSSISAAIFAATLALTAVAIVLPFAQMWRAQSGRRSVSAS